MQSTNTQLDAIKMAQSTAISSNEKIFLIFARKFASKDSRDYANTAQKLSAWLGSERAYYPAARPKIVELLEVALVAFRETYTQHPAAAELSQNLRQLVQAVNPFRNLFSEKELQSRLQHVVVDTEQCLARISQYPAHDDLAPPLPVVAGVPPPSLPTPPVPQKIGKLSMPMSISQGPVGQIRPAPSVVMIAPNKPVHAHASQALNTYEAVAPVQTEAISSGITPVPSDPHVLGNSGSSTVPSKPLPTRVRRAEIPQELVARDLDYFKSTQTAATVKEDFGLSSPKIGGPSSPAPVSDALQGSGQSPSPKKKTARMVPSRRLPHRVSLDAPDSTVPGPPASDSPHTSELLPEENRSIENNSPLMDVAKENLFMVKMEPGAPPVDIPPADEAQEDLQNEESLSLQTQLETSLVKEPEVQMDYQPSLVEAPSRNGEALVPAPLPTYPPITMSNRMGYAASTLGPNDPPSDPPSKPEAITRSSQMLGFPDPIIPPSVNALDPPLNLNFRISRFSSPCQFPASETMDTRYQRFDGPVAVIHSMRGKPFAHTHVIDVELKESTFYKISMWVNRRSHPSEAASGICISLACYRLPPLFDAIKSEKGKHDVQRLASRFACSWPCSGRLSLHVARDGGKLTPDHFVDVSSLLRPGMNEVRIKQQDDLSEYIVVLLAHQPTRAQLAEVDEVREKDERWRRFLEALCQPIDVPGREV